MSSPHRVRFLDRSSPPHIATLVLLTGASAMAMNMFLPSLPSMTAYFHTDYRLMQLSVALFLAMNGVLQIIIGPLSDHFGRRPVILAGFIVFSLATLGCIFATSATMFLAFRMVQAGVVVAVAVGRAAIRDMYDQDRSAAMIGYVTMGMAVVPMLTPAIGGWLDENIGWQANFWVFFAVGVLGTLLVWSDVGETHHNRSQSLRQQIADYPELLTSPRFWGYALAAAFSSGAFFAYLGGAPFIGSEIFGLSPTWLGFLFGTPAFGYILGNFISARGAMRFGINRLVLLGSVACTLGVGTSLAVFLAGFGSPATFFGFMSFVGLGNGLVLPNAIAGTLSVRPQLAGTASGLGGALMIGGGAALSAFAGSLLKAGSGPYPLLYIQLTVSALAVVAILMVIRRERRLKLV